MEGSGDEGDGSNCKSNQPMSEEPMDEKTVDEVGVLFERLGADAQSAATMARQLVRRSRQLAREESIEEEEALRRLLTKAIRGRMGEST